MQLFVCACAIAFVIAFAGTALAADPEAIPDTRAATSPPAVPSTYAAFLAGTTLTHRSPGGRFEGPQGDLQPAVGLGHFVTKTVALELDLSVGLARGAYAGTSAVPGIVWAFHDNFYAAARFLVPVHPETNLGIMPGLGAIYVFENGLAPLVEIDAVSMVARGAPDFGASVTIGSLYLF
jgi:hypothetical protein